MTWTESNTRFLPESVAENHPDMIVGENEIVMNLTAQSLKDDFLGRVCLTGVGERALLNQRLARLTPTGLDVRFAFLIFRSPIFRRFVSSLNTGSLIQHMFTKQLADFSVPVPPREEQIEITNFAEDVLSSVRRLRHCVEQQVNTAPLLRTSLLGAAFSGELTRESISV